MVLFIVGTAAFWKPVLGQQFTVDEVNRVTSRDRPKNLEFGFTKGFCSNIPVDKPADQGIK